MGYKWRPSKSQRRAFAQRMQNEDERLAYEERKRKREEKRRENSTFNYESAGGNYIPTEHQYHVANEMMRGDCTPQQINAATLVISAFVCNERVHHDYIHIVNEYYRENAAKS